MFGLGNLELFSDDQRMDNTPEMVADERAFLYRIDVFLTLDIHPRRRAQLAELPETELSQILAGAFPFPERGVGEERLAVEIELGTLDVVLGHDEIQVLLHLLGCGLLGRKVVDSLLMDIGLDDLIPWLHAVVCFCEDSDTTAILFVVLKWSGGEFLVVPGDASRLVRKARRRPGGFHLARPVHPGRRKLHGAEL